MRIDSKNDLFRKLPKNILSKIESRVNNKRQKKLVDNLISICLKLASYFNEFENYFVIVRMPLEV